MQGVCLFLLVVGIVLAVPADPGYQLGEPRTNAIGLGAAAVANSAGEIFVVGGSGDETRGLPSSGAGSFVFRDTKVFTIASRTWNSLQPLPLGQQRAFHTLVSLDAAASRLVVFGGSRDALFLNDLWMYTRGLEKKKKKKKKLVLSLTKSLFLSTVTFQRPICGRLLHQFLVKPARFFLKKKKKSFFLTFFLCHLVRSCSSWTRRPFSQDDWRIFVGVWRSVEFWNAAK